MRLSPRRHPLVDAAAAALLLSVLVACRTTPPSLQTPQGQIAYQAEDALDALGALQHAAITARRTNALSTAAMRRVVKATLAATNTIDAAITNGTGLVAAYKTAEVALTEAQRALTHAEATRLAPEFAAAHAILAALGGA